MKTTRAGRDAMNAIRMRNNIMAMLLKVTGPVDRRTRTELQQMSSADLATCTKIVNLAVKRALTELQKRVRAK